MTFPSMDDETMEHQHESALREERPIRAARGRPGGSIALEVCACGALRTVISHAGEITTSDWEQPKEEQS